MMRSLFLISLILAPLMGAYAPSSSCQPCHTTIYDEYATSMHRNASIYKDPIHNAVWNKNPLSQEKAKYGCGHCHTPATDNKSEIVQPNRESTAHEEAVSCAYCHRIESVAKASPFDKNSISKDENTYIGDAQRTGLSPHHKIDRTNAGFAMGQSCLGCHTHRENSHGFNVCQTDVNNTAQSNCVSCHMPRIKGASVVGGTQATHTFHGFPGLNAHPEMLASYIDIALKQEKEAFSVILTNHSSHALLLHPLRLGVLDVVVTRGGEREMLTPAMFMRAIGAEGKPTPPWLAKEVVSDTVPKAHESRAVSFSKVLKSGDLVDVTLSYYLVNPKAAVGLGLGDMKRRTLKQAQFVIK